MKLDEKSGLSVEIDYDFADRITIISLKDIRDELVESIGKLSNQTELHEYQLIDLAEDRVLLDAINKVLYFFTGEEQQGQGK